MRSWKDVTVGLIIGLALPPLAAISYFYFGLAPVATQSKPMPLEGFLAKKALHARIQREAPAGPPIEPTEGDLMSGAAIYREDCAVCHGLPGQQQTAIAKGMFPKPPQLLKGMGVTDDPVQETYWKVRNGIRLTGMPSYSDSLSETQIWQVSQLLAKAHMLPDPVQRELARSETASSTRLTQPR